MILNIIIRSSHQFQVLDMILLDDYYIYDPDFNEILEVSQFQILDLLSSFKEANNLSNIEYLAAIMIKNKMTNDLKEIAEYSLFDRKSMKDQNTDWLRKKLHQELIQILDQLSINDAIKLLESYITNDDLIAIQNIFQVIKEHSEAVKLDEPKYLICTPLKNSKPIKQKNRVKLQTQSFEEFQQIYMRKGPNNIIYSGKGLQKITDRIVDIPSIVDKNQFKQIDSQWQQKYDFQNNETLYEVFLQIESLQPSWWPKFRVEFEKAKNEHEFQQLMNLIAPILVKRWNQFRTRNRTDCILIDSQESYYQSYQDSGSYGEQLDSTEYCDYDY